MKVTESDNLKHRQLCLFEDYLQMVSAEQREYAEVCGSPKMNETVPTSRSKEIKGRVELTVCR